MNQRAKEKLDVQASTNQAKRIKGRTTIGKYYTRETLKCIDSIISNIDTYIKVVENSSNVYPKDFLEYKTSKLFFDAFILNILSLCEYLDMGHTNSWWMGLGLKTVNYKALKRLDNMPLNVWHLIAMRKKHPNKAYLDTEKDYAEYEQEFSDLNYYEWNAENMETFDGQCFERYKQWCNNDSNISIKDENVQLWIKEYQRIFTKWYDFVHYARFFCGYDEYHKKLIFDNKSSPDDWESKDDWAWFVDERSKRKNNLIEVIKFFEYIKKELNKEAKLPIQKTKVYKNRFALWKMFKEECK